MSDRCHWITDKETGMRVHIPGCWGGVHDWRGCYCTRTLAGRDAYEQQADDDVDLLERRVHALEERLKALEGRLT